MTTVYYPPLSSLVPTDALPEALGFVKDGIANLFSGLYFRDLQYSASPRGDVVNYSLTVLSSKPLELEIAGTGFFLELNPDLQTGQRSAFPVTLRYEWGILAWLRQFDLQSFSFAPSDFYQLALTALGMTERQLLDRAVSVFFAGGGSMLDRLQQLVDQASDTYGQAVAPLDPQSTDPLGDAMTKLETALGESASVIVFATCILDDLDLAGTEERLEQFLGGLFGGSVKDYFLKLITPRIDATLKLGAAIRFPPNVLRPVAGSTSTASRLVFDPGTFTFSTEGGIGYRAEMSVSLSPSPSQIGDTGFTIAIEKAKLDLSRTTNIPEATADGRPENFVGVYIENATITLPPFFNQKPSTKTRLAGRKILAGTGGLSGTVQLEAVDPTDPTPALIEGKFGSGFEIGLSSASVTFRQNVIEKSSLRGFMKIPGFKDTAGNDAEIRIEIAFGTGGEFSVTASEEQGIRALSIPGVLDVEIDSLSVGRKEGRFYVSVSGALDFADQTGTIGKFIPDKIEIQKLLIWDDGKVELEGGSIVLPRAVALKIGPVELSITAIHFGTLEKQHGPHLRKYAFFGFDGGVKVDPGGVEARGDGVKLYFTTDNDPNAGKSLHIFLRIQSIMVDLTIPGSAARENATVLLKGYLAMKDDGAGGTEYAGGIALALPKLAIYGSAAMRYNSRLPSFLIDTEIEISTPILLGSTGLGLWGFRGLLGMRYVAKKSAANLTDDDPWWQYYKAKISPDYKEGIQASKFKAQQGFSVGVGTSLATVQDAGRTFSSKLFLLLSLPDVLLLQGQAKVLAERIGLDTKEEAPFFAMIAVSRTSIEAAFGVDYKIPEGGEIADIDAVMEMGFFWGNSGAWYFNFGKDQPVDRRVRARILTLFDAYFYFMLSSGGIRTGAGVAYELKKQLGPFSVELRAYMDMAARVSFKPLQVGGSIELGGVLQLKIFGVGFSISAAASLSGEAPKPFLITGRIEVCVKVLFKKRCVSVELTWTFDGSLNASPLELSGADLSKSVQAVNVLTGETFAIYADGTSTLPEPSALAGFIVPMDSYIDLELKQGVTPPSPSRFATLGTAGGSPLLIPPQKAKSSQVRHEIVVDSIELVSWNPDTETWEPYDVYEAATPLQAAGFTTTSQLPFGYWQKMESSRFNRLRVLSLTPFSYMRPGTPNLPPPEDLGVGVEEVFCAPDPSRPECRTFTIERERSPEVPADVWRSMPDVLYSVGPNAGAIRRTTHALPAALSTDQDSTIHLLLPEPSAEVELVLSTEASGVEVTWYRRVDAEWEAVRVDTIAADDLAVPLSYEDAANPLLRVDVRGVACGRPLQPPPPLPQAGDLERFLDALARNRHLTHPLLQIYPERRSGWLAWKVRPLTQHTYYPTFLQTSLYTFRRGTQWVRYRVDRMTPTGLHAVLADSRGYDCRIELHPADAAAMEWTRVRTVRNLRPAEGSHDAFTADAMLDDKSVRRIAGRSCYTLQQPQHHEPPMRCSELANDVGIALLRFLDRVAQHGQLLATELLLLPNDDLGAVFYDTPLYGPTVAQQASSSAPAARSFMPFVTYRASREGQWLLINLSDPVGFSCTIRIEMPATADGVFPEVLAVIDLRPAPEGDREGEVYDFTLLLRLDRIGEVRVRGRSCYPVGECHRGCRTFLHRVCWLGAAAATTQLPSPAQVEAESQAMVEALSGTIQPTWRPDTYFAMRVKARDLVTRYDDGSALATHPTNWVLGWKTAGPVGQFHKYLDDDGNTLTVPAYAALESSGSEDEFKLATLQHYLDFARCYPNADGRLTLAKPLFYASPRLDLFYLQPYVYEMYRDWDDYHGAKKIWSSLRVEIIDPAPPPTVPAEREIEADWIAVPPARTTPEFEIVANMLANGDPCGDVDPPAAPPADMASGFPVIGNLEPLKLYLAIFKSVFQRDASPTAVEREVHRYVFPTSRYADFAEQIGSFAHDGLQALYDVEVTPDAAALAQAAAVLADPETSSDDLKQRFADPFDRLIDGILHLEPLPPPVTMEVDVVRLPGGRAIGLLLRSPEPLNDPKMPAAELASTVTLSIDGGPAAAYRAFHAKDAARVFVTNADHSLDVPPGAHALSFEYRRWNGAAYAVEASAQLAFGRS